MNENWSRERTPSGTMDYIIDERNVSVCSMVVRYGDPQYEERMALLLAAPRMRATIERALQDLTEDAQHDARFAVICDMLRDTLECVTAPFEAGTA